MLRALSSTCNVQSSACAVNATLLRSFASLHSCFIGTSHNPGFSTCDLQQQTSRCINQTAQGGADSLTPTKCITSSYSLASSSNGSSVDAAQEQLVLDSRAAPLSAASQQHQRLVFADRHHQLPVLSLAASSGGHVKHWNQNQWEAQPHRPWQQQQQHRQQRRGFSTSDGPEGNSDQLPAPSGQQEHHQRGRGGRQPAMLRDFQQLAQEHPSRSTPPSWQPVTVLMADRQHQEQTHTWHDSSQQQQQQRPLPLPNPPPRQQQPPEPEALMYPVHAVHLAGEIDFMGFANKYRDNFVHVIPAQRDHVLLQLESVSDNVDLLHYGTVKKSPEANVCFVVIYRYGSVIFSNVRRESRDEYLHLLRPFLKAPKGQPQMRPEDYAGLRSDETTIVVRSHLDHWSKLEPDKIVVQVLDAGNLRVISNVLSQSVALDYFNSRVDAAIQQFTPYLTAVAQTGQCDTVKEAGLLQLIADNSLLYTDVVTKIGLLDISQTAWKQDKHYDLWASLRADYEIEKRFDAINRKLGPMIENAKFLLDVRAEQKSSGAEWIIIGLIMLEVLMNGFGHLATFMWH